MIGLLLVLLNCTLVEKVTEYFNTAKSRLTTFPDFSSIVSLPTTRPLKTMDVKKPRLSGAGHSAFGSVLST
ncbi:hypothetical protein [Nitrosomonas ureae]|uniref:hypothetical protein n=1 Tax=Nitrosomonas ureae TaxID=44577 RepID=UPI0011B09374|nr:hypothetical protein [Nitrosomonas ureae]